MKKIISFLIVGFIVLGGLSVGAQVKKENNSTIQSKLTFSTPITCNIDNEYLRVELDNADSYIMEAGQPMLPKVATVFELEFGVKDLDVQVDLKDTDEMILSKQIIPAPEPIILDQDLASYQEFSKSDEIYQSKEIYPSNDFEYNVGCGLNSDGKRVTFVVIYTYPVRYVPADNKIFVSKNADIKISYTTPDAKPTYDEEYDLLIITPKKFDKLLDPLVEHKEAFGVKTMVKTVESIYPGYDGADKAEDVKLCIKDAIETNNITYVLLFGGLKSIINANDRESQSLGAKDWYVPVRYTSLYDGPGTYDPGTLSDLYYEDIYKAGGEFENWDPNGDGIYAARNKPGVSRDVIDLYPDVYVGRLAVRNPLEAKLMVDKIITYESTAADPSWFNKTILIGGDGFQDQPDLNIVWDTNGLPNGEYTIYAQTTNSDQEKGSIDIINVTINKDVASDITFSEEDHLKVDSYPAPPIAEITSPSEENILGNSDVNFVPDKAYIGDRWARVQYTSGRMYIRGKSYDPKPQYEDPYGSICTIKVWVNNSQDETVFGPIQKSSDIWFEGEYETLNAASYLSDFEKEILWTSNGNLTSMQDSIDAISEGSGFLLFAGHGNPNVWANHNPGIPGGRKNSSIYGLQVINPTSRPFLPMYNLKNGEKLPVCIVGGCHNSQFNVSFLKTLLGPDVAGYWTHGLPTPECWSWTLTRQKNGGSIATIGMTGLGYGYLGQAVVQGLGGYIDAELIRQYSLGNHNLGAAHGLAITNYIITQGKSQLADEKTVQEWALLGDPSLLIGGYSS